MRALVEIFFNPPMAVARFGASPTPLEAFEWRVSRDAHGRVLTVVEPALSFRVADDGRLQPYKPTDIRFKEDDGSVRPVAPFFELWARMQGADGGIEEEPFTLALLAELKITLRHLSVEVNAANLKAARRTNDDACGFQARVAFGGDDHTVKPLLACSPHTSGLQPLVLPDKPVPLGCVQWLKPVAERDPQHPAADLSVLRLRFTPAAGKVYGPPRAVQGPDRLTITGPVDVLQLKNTIEGRVHTIVPPDQRILSDDTPWSTYRMVTGLYEDPQPQDGYDGSDDGNSQSWGVVDDSCDALVAVTVAWRGNRYVAQGRAFVGPPAFAPDRRPFYSVADDLADRDLPLVPVTPENYHQVKAEVVQLFRRVFETAASMNMDAARTEALQDNEAMSAPPSPRLPQTGPASMTEADQPYIDRTPDLTLNQPPTEFTTSVRGDRLSYTQAVPFVHSQLMEEAVLIDFLRRRHAHVRRLLRPAFGLITEWHAEALPPPDPNFRDPRVVRDLMHDMRMPPYMRDAYYVPLSLTRRQYRMMIDFLDLLAKEEGATA
ncbi:hypothetical protein [Aquabacterium sp.]|uniref:hypothetical protein n=1 Tax=Aquabacterium sp. TaxID=1872578 RepID=UPI002C33157B|nr:hypothetical protein [Aquabacterium sp.]HSW07611.1 hypothetical protein [Aquabacterium sp.]